MTYEAFLDCLRHTPREWFLDAGGYYRGAERGAIRIRVDGEVRCPLSAVACLSSLEVIQAAAALKIAHALSHRIINAADDCGATQHPDVRRELLEACGLDERVAA